MALRKRGVTLLICFRSGRYGEKGGSKPGGNYVNKICNIKYKKNNWNTIFIGLIFFLSDFLSQSFTNHRTAGEERGHFFNSSLPLPPTS